MVQQHWEYTLETLSRYYNLVVDCLPLPPAGPPLGGIMVGRVLPAAGVMLGLPYPPVDMGPGLLYAPPEPLPALQIAT